MLKVKEIFLFIFLLINFIGGGTIADSPIQYQVGFQDPATPVMEGIIYLYDYIWNFLIFIVIFVTYFLIRILILFKEDSGRRVNPIVQNVSLEIIWTVTPALILLLISGNSISFLYSSEELLNPALDIIVIGNQWYWTYEFIAFKKKIIIESHMVETNDLNLGELRLLEVDNALVLPTEIGIRLLITSTDVIHSWAVPSLGIKIDAVPGRINEGSIFIKRTGVFRGQCSEICGKGHSVMPIVVLGINSSDYNVYLHYMYSLEK